MSSTERTCLAAFERLKRGDLLERHDVHIDHETLRRVSIAEGILEIEEKAQTYRASTARAAASLRGACSNRWLPSSLVRRSSPKCTLYVDVDDATSSYLALHFAEQETTLGYFDLARQHILEHGVPLAFYADKFGVFA